MGGINLSEITKRIDELDATLTKNLPEPPNKGLSNKNSGKICSKTLLGCDMAYAIQSLPEEERLSCEYNYCQESFGELISMRGDESSYTIKRNKVCKASEKRYEQIEDEVKKEKKKHKIHSENVFQYEKARKLEEPLYKFKDLCRYEIEDMPRDEKYGHLPYIFLD